MKKSPPKTAKAETPQWLKNHLATLTEPRAIYLPASVVEDLDRDARPLADRFGISLDHARSLYLRMTRAVSWENEAEVRENVTGVVRGL
jgi:hypothetical protein